MALRADVKGEFFSYIGTGHSNFHLLGWSNEAGDAADRLSSVLHSPSGSIYGALNSLGLVDADLDSLIEAAETAATAADRVLRLRAAFLRASRLRAALPLLVRTEAVVHSRRVAWDPPILTCHPGMAEAGGNRTQETTTTCDLTNIVDPDRALS